MGMQARESVVAGHGPKPAALSSRNFPRKRAMDFQLLCPATGTQGQAGTVAWGTYGLIRCLGAHPLLPDGEVERILHICF